MDLARIVNPVDDDDRPSLSPTSSVGSPQIPQGAVPAFSNAPSVSFIGIVDFSPAAVWLYASWSCYDLLGYEPQELIGRPSMEWVHPDEFSEVERLHNDVIREDKAASLAYLRMKHKDPIRGYILCAVSETVAHNVLVGSVSLASPGAKAMHNAATAKEVKFISPPALTKGLEFNSWNDPSPLPKSPPQSRPWHESANSEWFEGEVLIEPRSIRTAVILDRFSAQCPITYITNDHILSTTTVLGRSFYDFVAKRDEQLVRSWLDCIKSWGVNDRGQPSDGGFGFGKFWICPAGRDSSLDSTDAPTNRQRPGGTRGQNTSGRVRASRQQRSKPPVTLPSRPHPSSKDSKEFIADAVFSPHSDGILIIVRRAETTE